jgi:hypothetical protein
MICRLLKKRDNLKNQDIGGKIILQRFLRKWVRTGCIALIYLRAGISGLF